MISFHSCRQENAQRNSALGTQGANRHRASSHVFSMVMSRGVAIVLGMVAVCGESLMAVWNPFPLFNLAIETNFLSKSVWVARARKLNRIQHRHQALATHGSHAQHNCHALRYHNGAHIPSGSMAIDALGAENWVVSCRFVCQT